MAQDVKTKPKNKPRPHPLAEELFNIGMCAWLKVDKKKAPVNFSTIDSPGQLAAWNAIAIFVERYGEKRANHDHS